MTGKHYTHVYEKTAASAVAANATVEIDVDPNARTHQFDAWAVGGTVGTVAFYYEPYLGPADAWLPVLDKYGAAVVLNLASRSPEIHEVTAQRFKMVCSGADGTWNYGFVGRG